MILRRDHIAGGVLIAAGAFTFAASGDLPIGTLANPGAGMMPKLALTLLIGFGLLLVLRAGESPPNSSLDWSDLPHAAIVTAVAAGTIAIYTAVGFVLSVTLMMLVLMYLVERRRLMRAAAVSIGVTMGSYYLFNNILKSPLPPVPYWLWF
jgi:hypothetical protein